MTAVVLTQATFGRSVKATIDYLVGTLGGAVYAGAVGILVPHSNDVSLAGVLALAVAPLAFLGGVYPSLSVAPSRAYWCSWFLGSSTWAPWNPRSIVC